MNYSVLMTVYCKDSPEYLVQSVSSMLDQTYKTDEFVLVCDGKLTDDLEESIKTVFKGYESILNIVRLPENVGLGKALNIGLPLCKNSWVARMDDDDIAHINRCEVQIDFIKKHPGISIIGSYVNEFSEDNQKPIRVKKVPIDEKDIIRYAKRRNPFCHSSLMIKKEDILAAGNYSTMRTNQDVETWVRVLNKGFIGANIPLPLVDFRFDHKTYKRRKDINNILLMIKTWFGFYKNGYCSLIDFLYVLTVQTAVFLMPEFILKKLYNKYR